MTFESGGMQIPSYTWRVKYEGAKGDFKEAVNTQVDMVFFKNVFFFK